MFFFCTPPLNTMNNCLAMSRQITQITLWYHSMRGMGTASIHKLSNKCLSWRLKKKKDPSNHKNVACWTNQCSICALCALTQAWERAPAPWWLSLHEQNSRCTGSSWWIQATRTLIWTWCHSRWCWAGGWTRCGEQHVSAFFKTSFSLMVNDETENWKAGN